MHIQTDAPLSDYTTMRLGGPARMLIEVASKDELVEAVTKTQEARLPLLILGEGSNIIIRDEGFKGVVIINRILGFEVLKNTDESTTIRIGAGEHWDDVVKKTVEMGLSGIEFLSLIPGTAGGTPIQNVGAYGAEIADVLDCLEAYDLQDSSFATLTNTECQFAYRNSRFKPMEGRHYIVTSITLTLKKMNPKPPFYASLQKYLDAHNIDQFTPQIIRQAVIAIRNQILPEPSRVANCGSFFKNPIVSNQRSTELREKYPDMPTYPAAGERVKLSAGWLIEQAGLKGYHAHGMRTYEKSALVMVNESAKSYHDLELFKNEIIGKIREQFGITLEQEPELL